MRQPVDCGRLYTCWNFYRAALEAENRSSLNLASQHVYGMYHTRIFLHKSTKLRLPITGKTTTRPFATPHASVDHRIARPSSRPQMLQFETANPNFTLHTTTLPFPQAEFLLKFRYVLLLFS
ncbi:uncharacterized protein ARMOST_04178 [Armillaria ostoyae]|uniref:Uncharacterized protein n=1 Tax=Armillaria ostoyae TaxID=47428 RepID=A0A284QWN8_ARMOS|nr:uncharacterized protein ARMOST_04178 [Armillaria ostoyae]